MFQFPNIRSCVTPTHLLESPSPLTNDSMPPKSLTIPTLPVKNLGICICFIIIIKKNIFIINLHPLAMWRLCSYQNQIYVVKRYGIEQEYTLLQKDLQWPLGWPVGGFPGPQVYLHAQFNCSYDSRLWKNDLSLISNNKNETRLGSGIWDCVCML